MASTSTRTTFDKELHAIRDGVLRLGSLVDQAIERAFEALRNHDGDLARTVIKDDQVINDLRYTTEERITSTMALQQPMAHDLRLLLASLIIVNELERMGDYAEGIARTIIRYPVAPMRDLPHQLPEMTRLVREMLSQAMDAFLHEGVDEARQTADMDDKVDALYKGLFNDIVEQMGDGELPVARGTYVLWAGHNLERIGDRVTNICERVIFTKTGHTGRGMNPKSTGDTQD